MGQLQVPINSPLHLDAGDKRESDKGQILEATAQGFLASGSLPYSQNDTKCHTLLQKRA